MPPTLQIAVTFAAGGMRRAVLQAAWYAPARGGYFPSSRITGNMYAADRCYIVNVTTGVPARVVVMIGKTRAALDDPGTARATITDNTCAA